MAGRTQTLREILDKKPNLQELSKYIILGTKWHVFGTQLGLKPAVLDGIQVSTNEDLDYKTMKMFQSWLDTNDSATRQQIVDTLRLEVIGLNRIAKDYEDALMSKQNNTYHNINVFLEWTSFTIHNLFGCCTFIQC